MAEASIETTCRVPSNPGNSWKVLEFGSVGPSVTNPDSDELIAFEIKGNLDIRYTYFVVWKEDADFLTFRPDWHPLPPCIGLCNIPLIVNWTYFNYSFLNPPLKKHLHRWGLWQSWFRHASTSSLRTLHTMLCLTPSEDSDWDGVLFELWHPACSSSLENCKKGIDIMQFFHEDFIHRKSRSSVSKVE